MIDWIYIVISLSFLLLAFLLWKEISRQNKARLLWRILATVFAIISLACLALPINYHRTKTMNAANEAVLLTEGFDVDSLKQFLQSTGKNMPVFTLNERLTSARKFNASLVADPGFYATKDFNALHVFGYGLGKEELAGLNEQAIVFHPSKVLTGITSISWQSKVKSGDKIYVSGRYNNTSPSRKKIILTGFNTTLDSVNITANSIQKFALTTIPKHEGRSVYYLSVIKVGDTIEKEPVPVQVDKSEPLKVLILASSPDFENKFLKNMLARKGYEVVVRTAISKNKFYKEYLNTNSFDVDRITTSLLDKFDITIADAAELASLSKQELATIQSNVIQKNKGLIIRADSTASRSSFYTSRFPLASVNSNLQKQISLHLLDSTTKLEPLAIESPLFIHTQNGTQPLVMDKQNRVFVNSTLYGSGKVIFSTLSNTFSWALSGYQNDYDYLWSALLNKAAGKKVEEETWSVSPTLPQVNKPVTLSLQTNNPGIPQAQVQGASLYLRNNYDLPFMWTGSFWPTREGWQAGIQLNGSTYYWYAYGNNEWKYVQASNKMQITKQYEQTNLVSTASNKQTSTLQVVEFPKIYFFLLFLICCGFLWLENKYYNS